MKRYLILGWRKVMLVAWLMFTLAVPRVAMSDESGIKLQKWSGTIHFVQDEPSAFTMAGEASHLGKFSTVGEVTFAPGITDGSMVGEGVADFTAASGEHLVGVVHWDVDSQGGDLRTTNLQFHWRDSVTFGDGSVHTTTGHFVKQRPPGLVVIAIIAILIGLLLPAVQKVR